MSSTCIHSNPSSFMEIFELYVVIIIIPLILTDITVLKVNILINNVGAPMVSGYGLSPFMTPQRFEGRAQRNETEKAYWYAPELFCSNPIYATGSTIHTDIYSLACVMLEVRLTTSLKKPVFTFTCRYSPSKGHSTISNIMRHSSILP